ncbi:class I SAM-dependent methyltransferase [Roseovarius sp. SK2]|uniref:class I SAM-dependent methyltransferase n=1 Tax=Roseovarius TaxID=74030 RepID=UPI00237A1D50|nr:class I SAM-dependent methyltransferase [Roseovarius sp. SK2]MDD9726762.1 class I SAM-dependent methyltransferase [Roseovarius sp. SK2]
MPKAATHITAAPARPAGWPRARGRHYLDVLEVLHLTRAPEWYLEIGAGRGHSLERCPGKAIAVDPTFRLGGDVTGDKPALHLIQKTSGDFFASGQARELAPRIDMAFIDGMHLFEYVLDDFIATEKLCHKDATILLHDLVPFSPAAAEREWDPERTKGWSGDVWKMTLILREYRPELAFDVLNPRPCGLGIVTGLDPENRVLEDARDEIVEKFMDLTIEGFGPKNLSQIMQMRKVEDVLPDLKEMEVAE